MKIARIAELNKGFLVIFEDSSELRLSEEVYFTCSVYEKEEMSDSEIENLLFKEKVTEGLIICKKYLAGGIKPRRRLFVYMENRGIEKDVSEEVLSILERENYLDDFKYALKRVKRKMGVSPVSAKMMVDCLENEGLEHDIAEKAVKKHGINDYKTAFKLAEKKLKTTKGNKQKTAAYLASKGFDEEIITEILGLEGLWNV
ncbi:MAG: RecX family transcriptional regulator [Clostridiales bacterium]|nr:RecX family transcriptional regulator [Clostridiales bacterium]